MKFFYALSLTFLLMNSVAHAGIMSCESVKSESKEFNCNRANGSTDIEPYFVASTSGEGVSSLNVGEALYGVPPFKGKSIKLNFHSVNISTVLKVIGRFSSRVMDYSGPDERISVEYPEPVPWDKVIYDIANQYGYQYQIEKSKITVSKISN